MQYTGKPSLYLMCHFTVLEMFNTHIDVQKSRKPLNYDVFGTFVKVNVLHTVRMTMNTSVKLNGRETNRWTG